MAKLVHVSGWATCSWFRKARTLIEGLSILYPTKISANVKEFATRDEYKSWLSESAAIVKSGSQTSSPYCWYGDTEATFTRIGGFDDTLAWTRSMVSASDDGSEANGAVANTDVFDTHDYDFDCIVVGGGSGGLACAKEISQLGFKVACLDYVKPSPAGSTWGLGGTCVNVGCIPKKLMHTAALHGEHAEHAKAYGWNFSMGTHDWATMRQNVQDHIKGLNFGYRVQLREKGVQYLNKLGKFIDAHTLEVTDKKGNVSTITGRRFVVAVGGRPSPLSCPGGELAISSDDLFSLDESPGKTCVIGAGYVALECAGFISGLKQGEVTVAVRSIPLRGFDTDVVDYCVEALKANGTGFKMGVTPSSIEKLPSGMLKVTLSDGSSDEYKTVLAATGRRADTQALGLDTLVDVNPKNGKIVCSNEQTSVPHIYAVGDVVDNAPELTPVAIQAGRLLAHRLFGDSTQTMNYKKVATTVFTPLELGTVGLTEAEAVEQFGAKHVDAYLSLFTPLEWTIVEDHSVTCYAKIVIDRVTTEVLGIHIAAPNAGEIIQGFAVAFRKGMKYADLSDTVGIHPTTAEELCGMTVTRSSGEKVEKSAC